MADESRWDEDERRRRWEEERYRQGRYHGPEGQFGLESYRGQDRPRGYGAEDYGREDRRYADGRAAGYGGGYGYGSPAAERYRRSYGQDYGGPGRDYEGRSDYRRYDPSQAGQGYVGFGPDQGFWRSGGYTAGQGSYGPPRGFMERAGDEVSSWFGDEDAERRRQMDAQREGRHRGRGPRGYMRSDERIREDVCDRLSDDAMVDASDIEIDVGNGEVTLNGHVDSRWAKRRAEDIADDISGVKHVQNNLRVRQDWSSAQTGGTQPRTAGSATQTAAPSSATRTREKV